MISHPASDWIGFSLATATGGAGASYYLLCVFSGSVAKRWPVVAGVVTSSTIQQTPSRLGSYYKPRVKYTYAVAGVTYTGNRRRFDDDDYAFKASATSRLAKYVPGAQIPVHYDPGDPSCSVLQPGTEWRTYSYIVFFGALLLVGLGLLFGYFE